MNVIKYKIVYDCIIYILYYILAYIQHNRNVSLENSLHTFRLPPKRDGIGDYSCAASSAGCQLLHLEKRYKGGL
jgi:hypothetical protein